MEKDPLENQPPENLEERTEGRSSNGNFKEILGVDISEEEVEQIVKKIDKLTQDDASTYELNALLIKYDECEGDDNEKASIGKQIRTKVFSILARE